MGMPEGTKIQQLQPTSYIFGLYRKNATTQEQYCKHQEEMTFMAETYLTYLSAQRAWYGVQQEYHAKGERSVAQTAKIVGFNLPHEPKVERRERERERDSRVVPYHTYIFTK